MTTRPRSRGKPGPKSRKKAEKVEVLPEEEAEIGIPLAEEEPVEIALPKPLPVVEVMTCFNQRSVEGRVVINPPQRMAPLKTHSTEEKWFFCRFCGRSYVDPIKYNAHVEEHESLQAENPTGNADADGEDSEDEVLINYKKRISDSTVEKRKSNLTCQVCGVEVFNPRERREHVMKFHCKHSCDQCGAGFAQASYLRNHVKRCHNPANEFQCPHCPCKLATHYAQSHHVYAYHTTAIKTTKYLEHKVAAMKKKAKLIQRTKPKAVLSDKPPSEKPLSSTPIRSRVVSNILYRCKICKKTFQKAPYLRKHHLIHTGEKPIPCTLCPQMFRTRRNLWGHVQSNHKNRTFQCSYCSCSFATSPRVTAHERRFHPEKAV